ncbi:MAG: ECF-type sigma factor [Phycisphaerales bacterium]
MTESTITTERAPTRRASTDTMMADAYGGLRRLAESRLRHLPPGLTMQATAVVHEAWIDLRASDGTESRWTSRAHFEGAAARAVREVVVDAARRRCRLKRGGDRRRTDLRPDLVVADALPADPESILRLDEGLRALEDAAPGPAEVVRLRWFGGMTHESIAAATETSVRTVERRWRFARAWLAMRLQDDGASS